MPTSALLELKYADPEARRVFEQERLVLEVCEALLSELQARNLTKADLASLLGSSRANVTQLLSGSRNMTLRTLADISWALGRRADFQLTDLEAMEYQRLDLPEPVMRPRIAMEPPFDQHEADSERRDSGAYANNEELAIAA